MWRDPEIGRDPRDRDLVRRDRGGGRARRDGEIRSNVVSSQAELHAQYGGVVPEIASRRHLELVSPVIEEALDARRRDARRRRDRRRHGGARADRGAARRARGREGDRLGQGAAARAGQPPARPRRLALPRAASTSSRRSPACSRAAGTRFCSTSRGASGRRRTRDRDDARRRRRRGVRQGRAPARAAVSGRGRDRPARARRAIPDGLRLPGRARARARLLVLRAQDRAPLRRPRPRAGELERAARRPRRELPAGDRPRARRAGRGGRRRPDRRSSAASPRTRSFGRRFPAPSRRRSRSAPTTRR